MADLFVLFGVTNSRYHSGFLINAGGVERPFLEYQKER
jgi:hypothetical protein